MNQFILVGLLTLFSITTNAQYEVTHGKYDNSYILSWTPIDSITEYEFVVTDNSNCYAGCSGDTRSELISKNEVLIFPTYKNKTYYWRIRPVLSTYDTTQNWSSISSFETDYKIEYEEIDFISIYPNPSIHKNSSLKIDLSDVNQNASIHYSIHDLKGNRIDQLSATIERKELDEKKYYVKQIDLSSIPSGSYMLKVECTNPAIFKYLFFSIP